MLTVDLGGGTAPITVRQHSVAPPDVDAKVRLTVNGAAVVLPDGPT
jgi:iron(III) transport system ATP-binding protein